MYINKIISFKNKMYINISIMGATFSISESNNWLDGDYDSSQFVARKYYGKYYNNLNDDINKNNKYVPSKETCKKHIMKRIQ